MKRCTLRRASTFLALFSVLLVANIGWSADKEKSDKDKSDIEKSIDNSAKVIDEIMATPKRLMRSVWNDPPRSSSTLRSASSV